MDISVILVMKFCGYILQRTLSLFQEYGIFLRDSTDIIPEMSADISPECYRNLPLVLYVGVLTELLMLASDRPTTLCWYTNVAEKARCDIDSRVQD